MMQRFLLVALAFAGMAHAHTVELERYYHESVGIPLAKSIKKAESEVEVNERILGGRESRVTDHPYAGGLLIGLTDGNVSVCTCSLLNERNTLTAGHCWYDGKKQGYIMEIVYGINTLYNGGYRIQTNTVSLHENFDYRSLNYDLCMLHHSAVPLNKYIQPVQLPYGQLLNYDFNGEQVTAVGYGRTASAAIGAITYRQVRREVDTQVINNKLCYQVYGYWVTPRTICTRPIRAGLGTCQGDSGGPLTKLVNSRHVQVGVTSFGKIICDEPPHFSAFSRVTAFMPWITSKLR